MRFSEPKVLRMQVQRSAGTDDFSRTRLNLAHFSLCPLPVFRMSLIIFPPSLAFLFLLASYSICQGVRTDYECFFLRIKIFEENKREDIVTAIARHMWMSPNIASIQNMYLLYIFIQSGARNVIHFNIKVRFQEIMRQNKVIYGISFINNNFSGFCDAIYHDSIYHDQFCE